MPSQTKENYLKTIFFLSNERGDVPLSELSKEMGVSIPTANSMVKKLQENEWVVYQKYKPLTLTAKGKKTAALIIRKHRLAEMFLAEKMGFGWEEVHDIAEELEHIDSVDFFERMDEMLGNPTIDPHGSPIPDRNGFMLEPNYIRLTDANKGDKVCLRALQNSSNDFLIFLNSKMLELGVEMTVQAKESFDQSMTVSYGDFTEMMLSKEVCERLLIEVVK